MKLILSLLFTTMIARTLLEEAADVFDKDEAADISYSNQKLSNSRLVAAFPGWFQSIFLKSSFLSRAWKSFVEF